MYKKWIRFGLTLSKLGINQTELWDWITHAQISLSRTCRRLLTHRFCFFVLWVSPDGGALDDGWSELLLPASLPAWTFCLESCSFSHRISSCWCNRFLAALLSQIGHQDVEGVHSSLFSLFLCRCNGVVDFVVQQFREDHSALPGSDGPLITPWSLAEGENDTEDW